ncbi:MAG TPA: hypothetical protein P5205_13045 [Candidatus Paceibacterota bacterium]|nr:hypothetical protein [Verrucomicrobiota bacterium]HSA11288.1 hypothetical protein [Candidatus Paceibacterota bacterium]
MKATALLATSPGMEFEWAAMPCQEKLLGSSNYFTFALGNILVYFVLTGQCEGWITPAAIILALLGTVTAVSTSMMASSSPAVPLVPSFFVVLQRLAERKGVQPAQAHLPEKGPEPVA